MSEQVIEFWDTGDGWYESKPGDRDAISLAHRINLPIIPVEGTVAITFPKSITKHYVKKAAEAGVRLDLHEHVCAD